MRRVLVTGGAGFIGSHFIRYFLRNHPSDAVVNLDKLTYAGNLKSLSDVEEDRRYEFVRGDIADPVVVRSVMKRVETVINFAAETHVDRSIKDASSFIGTNYAGVHTLLEAGREAGIKRFVQISTDEVYGSAEGGSFDEDAPLRPNSPYAASKAAADLLVRSYAVTYRLPVIVVRSSNNFGPYQFPEKVIPLFVTNLIAGKKVPLYSRGENIRDWIYVEDNCRAIDLVLEKGKEGEIYNVAGGNEMSNISLTRKILRALGKGEEFIEFVADRPGHDFRYSVANTKIRKLGFVPGHSFDEGLKLTVEWYHAHRDWWEPLKKDEFTLK